jgi:hypothetical protein
MRYGLVAAASLVVATAIACGGSKAPPKGADRTTVDAGVVPVASAAPVERPFAATPLEAQTMIQAEIDARMKGLWTCVERYRKGIGDSHRAVTINVGIDQEGRLFGVTGADAKHALDPALGACVLDALGAARFPRSHTGVITVKQVFQDAAIAR